MSQLVRRYVAVSEFNAWKITAGLTTAELLEREAELNMLFTACRHNAYNPKRAYYTSGGDGYFMGRIGEDRMLM
jgi:hypothetical protein